MRMILWREKAINPTKYLATGWYDTDGNPAEPCEHIKMLVTFVKDNQLKVDACGECESPWISCARCNLEVLNADNLF